MSILSSNIVLIGEADIFREALRHVLALGDFRIVGDFGSVAALAPDSIDQKPDLAVMLSLPVDAADVRRLHERWPAIRIVALGSGGEGLALSRSVEAGVDAVLLKDTSIEVLLQSLRLVVMGQSILPMRFAHRTMVEETAIGSPFQPAGQRTLTSGERRVLSLLAEGKQNKLIARHLGVSEATVKVHVRRVLRKIGAANRTQAAIWATRSGITPMQQIAS